MASSQLLKISNCFMVNSYWREKKAMIASQYRENG